LDGEVLPCKFKLFCSPLRVRGFAKSINKFGVCPRLFHTDVLFDTENNNNIGYKSQ
jgi:hypothetical protein